jgi:hypothetical protein
MSGFKRTQPALRFSADKITPDEIDRYEVVTFTPGTAIAWYWLGTSGTADVKNNVTLLNVIPDWPRNIQFNITGSSTGMAGSVDVNGKDQFGSVLTETIGFGSVDNGGSALGTKVFGQVTSANVRFGTFAGANGTTRLGFSSAGTTTLFGLPVKLGASTDVVTVSAGGGTDSISINGGTVGTMVLTAMHALRSPKPVTGTMEVRAWVRSSYNPTDVPISIVANGSQAT